MYFYVHINEHLSDGTTPAMVAFTDRIDMDDLGRWRPATPEEIQAHGRYVAAVDPERMRRFEIEVTRTISTTVTALGADADAAMDLVDKAGFPLPPRDTWSGHRDWSYRVFDQNGVEVGERDS